MSFMPKTPRPDKLLAINAGKRGLYDGRITQADVASALSFAEGTGNIGHGAYLLAMLLYRLDTDVIPSLVKVVREEVRQTVGDYPQVIIDRLSRVAIMEISGSTLCMTCNGQGSVMIGDKHETCPICEGAGYKPMTKANRARIAGIARQTWEKSYEKKYQEIYPTLQFWQSAVLHNIAFQFRGNDATDI